MTEEDIYKERLELALEAAGLDLWENDLATGEVTRKVSKVLAELGYSGQEASIYMDDLFAIVHPDDVAEVKAAIAGHVSGTLPQYRCEFRLRAHGGAWVWYANYGRIMDVGGRHGKRFIGVTFNIDDRKRKEHEIAEANRKLAKQNALLEGMNASLQLLASTDSLTGLANRRKLMERGASECKRALRFGHSLSLLILDIDLFKQVNDTWGHPIGDRVICSVADTCLNGTRKGLDIVARIGGEEFAILLPETDYANACGLAEWLRKTVELQQVIVSSGASAACTVSIGVATLPADAASLSMSDTALFEILLNKADKGLYQAKQNGRNCVLGSQAVAASFSR